MLQSLGRQANGLSCIGADEYLTDDVRVTQFREFLRDYQSWLIASEGPLHTAAGLSADKLLAFTRTIDAVLAGDETHPDVQPVQH